MSRDAERQIGDLEDVLGGVGRGFKLLQEHRVLATFDKLLEERSL